LFLFCFLEAPRLGQGAANIKQTVMFHVSLNNTSTNAIFSLLIIISGGITEI
jgi:hypothetical protein